MKIVVVVDVQRDFVYGALGSTEAQAAMKDIIDRLMQIDSDDKVIFTRDTHEENYLETQEGKNLPVPHCIYGTLGWQIAAHIDDIPLSDQVQYVNKPIFGSYELIADMEDIRSAFDVDEVELFGFCTDICVMSNAILAKATLPEVPVNVVADCCACVTPESHKTALEAMKLCQINII